MKNFTAVIPTLLKNRDILIKLIESLLNDSALSEIIVINNSEEYFEYIHEKVRVIANGKNLFVNPSWNLGVKEAKTDYVALINDDIKIPTNLCSKILDKMNNKHGIVGISKKYVVETRDEDNNTIINIDEIVLNDSKDVELQPISYRTPNFGVLMIFNKKDYVQIPEELKIYYGDDWLVYQATKNKKLNMVAEGQEIYHLGSLSSKSFNTWAYNERKIYLNKVYPWYKRIFNSYETPIEKVFFIFFLKVTIKKKNIDI